MKLTGNNTEAIYRRYAIVSEADLTDGLKKLALLEMSVKEKLHPCGAPTDFSHGSATISEEKPQIPGNNLAEGARFELADPLRGLRFSRPARSAAPSPLHQIYRGKNFHRQYISSVILMLPLQGCCIRSVWCLTASGSAWITR